MHTRLSVQCLLLLLSCLHWHVAIAFDFSFGAPTQCDNLNITWSGGQPPFQLLVAPLFNTQQNISIPASAFNDTTGQGFYQMPLTLPAGREFLLSMSDANGFGTGGTSDILTTGSSISGTHCNTTSPAADFFFELNTALQQCRAYTFSNYVNATQPATIWGLIPVGDTFELHPPAGPASFDWTANVAAGTSVVFVMTDSQGHRGGSSDVKVVGTSDDTSCLDASSPASTANASSMSQVATATATTTVRVTSGAHVSAGVIVGAVAGALFFIAAVTLLVLCLLRRKRQATGQESPSRPASAFINRRRSTLMSSRRRRTQPVDLLHRPPMLAVPSSSTLPPPAEYEPDPFILPSEPSVLDGHSTVGHERYRMRPSAGNTPISPTSAHTRNPSLMSEAARRKAHMAGVSSYHTPARLILHTDAEDQSMDGEEVVELPPQYTDRSTPSHSESQSQLQLQPPHTQAYAL